MEILNIPVERLREGPLELTVDMLPGALELADDEFKFETRVTGEVVFRLVGHDVLASGRLRTQVQTVCMRCLEPLQVDLNAPVNEAWMKGESREEADLEFSAEESLTRIYSGEEIEVGEVLRELIMAELPIRVYCREDCKGLCPHCGANLNEGPCQCAPAAEPAEDKRLPEWKQALKNIKLQP